MKTKPQRHPSAQALNHAILQSMDALVVVVDREGVIMSANEAWTRVAGAAPGGPVPSTGVGADYLAVCRRAGAGDPSARQALAGIRAVVAGKAPRFSLEYPCHFGQERHWYLMSVTPLLYPAGGAVISHLEITARHRQAEALVESEARLRTILETAAEGIITIDERGSIESFNPAAERMFGYPAAAVVGRNVSLLMPSPDRERHDGYLAHHRDTGEQKIIGIGREVFGRRRDGTVFPLDLSVSEVRVSGRRIFTGILRDITRRKRAEEALRESEERLRLALEASEIGTFEMDLASGQTYWNATEYKLLGLQPGEAKPSVQTFFRFVHPDDVSRLRAEVDVGIETGKFDTAFRIIRADGEVRWLAGKGGLGFPQPGTGGSALTPGRPSRFLGVNFDITESRRAKEALRQSEAHLATAQRIAQVGSYEVPVNPPGALRLSLETGRILGISAAEPGLTADGYLQRIVHPEDRERVRQQLHHALQNHTRYEAVYRIVRPDGTLRHVHSLADPVLAPDGQVEKLIGSMQDITERKRLEQEVLEISEREQRRIGQDLHDGLCQHLAGVEFRLLALQQKLARRSPKLAAEARALSRLVQAGIGDTRKLARGLSPVMLDADGLTDALRELADNTARTFKVACHFDCPAPVPIHDNSVATHLYRIAQEAVHNAVRHGKPTVITVTLMLQQSRVLLAIKDNGVGLPAVRPKRGGIGLHVMQYRAGMIGGSLAVHRDPEGGTSVICSVRLGTPVPAPPGVGGPA